MPLRPRHQWPGGYRAAKKAQDVASIEAAGHSRLPWEGATLAHRRPQAATYLPLACKLRADFGIGRRDRADWGTWIEAREAITHHVAATRQKRQLIARLLRGVYDNFTSQVPASGCWQWR